MDKLNFEARYPALVDPIKGRSFNELLASTAFVTTLPVRLSVSPSSMRTIVAHITPLALTRHV